ncbi:DUF3137 domain-containing protein [Spiroplasma endosymbiont of Stenodema calcarata]|uniref:DUF3137 domain-containing protein n=1 Tax=Spiroplasma endosymbiont of Stenodema calcarata TaxID=3139328 RepID=UPI003CCAA28C
MNIPRAFFTRLHSFGVLLQVIIFVASLVTLSLTGWLTLKYWKAIKLQKLIIQELPLAKLYQTGLELFTTKQYQITEIKKEFNLFPQAAVPPSRQIKQDYVLNFNKGKNNYSFGTLTRKEVTGSGENSDVVYTRYPYLTIDVNESLTLVATIKAMRTFLKIFKTKDNTSLEATEFEKIFAVDANDQILIRKLLTPKVILNLIELANNKIKIPLMQFDGRYITIAFNRYNVLNFNDPKGSLLGVFLLVVIKKLLQILLMWFKRI